MTPLRPRTRRRALAMTAALAVLPAASAWAHPSFSPNQLPVGQPVETVFVIPHGCAPGGGRPQGGDVALATVRIDLGHRDDVTIVPAAPVEGWDVADDGEATVWTDAGGATSDPIELPVTLTVHGKAGQEVFLPVYQECEGGDSFRWVALPGEDGDPAAKLVLTDGGPGTVDIADSHASESAPDSTHDGADHAASSAPAADSHTATDVARPIRASGAAGQGAGGISAWVAALAAVAVVAAGVAAVARRRRAT